MSEWDVISEEASIVLVGNFNPRIFHPEWFIRKSIIEEWDYTEDKNVNLPDLSQIQLPSERKLTVMLNKFVLQSYLTSDHLALKDFILSTFAILKESPIIQIGMNYTSVIKIPDRDKWVKFGEGLAPKAPWLDAAPYINDLDSEKQLALGLWEMQMQIPRDDELLGFIRPKISIVPPLINQTLSFNINNHIELEEPDTSKILAILEEKWEHSLELSHQIQDGVINSQLEA